MVNEKHTKVSRFQLKFFKVEDILAMVSRAWYPRVESDVRLCDSEKYLQYIKINN